MPNSPQARAAQYRERAAELRRLAAQIRNDEASRRKLIELAEQFEALAASLDRRTLGG